jgi:hypothetical protein
MTSKRPTISQRIDKTIEWLEQSRDQWKVKCLEAKLQLKRQTLATKRAREGRSDLKDELKEARERILELESISEKQARQLDDLKKKYSSKATI